MIKRMYSVYDKARQEYIQPQCYMTESEAKRQHLMQMKRFPDSPLVEFPMDFELCYIGDFNDQTGEIFEKEPKHICKLSDLRYDENPLEMEIENVPQTKRATEKSNPFAEMKGEIDEQDRKEEERATVKK